MTHSAASYGGWSGGIRRDTPTTRSTPGSSANRRNSAVPMLPLAPTTTIRMTGTYPVGRPSKRPATGPCRTERDEGSASAQISAAEQNN
ncbi:hypothetical protein Voc01_014950 [Virgisporangium ochraceum]|uniref:Uncharacterized protein n=1 Tax=Virgisporangium ochraceum TaxID=65505 RepID=A0A8J3ZRG2_9ACTN|nr:hypothetical protein Voc01_014950 [Virgisporangium ochraceum]